jgi:type IV pilus assembly protein PilB
MSEHRTIGQILTELGRVTPEEVEKALAYQQEKGGYFGEALVAMGVVREEELGWSLASQFDLPFIFPDAPSVDPEAASLVSPEWALRHNALPIARSRDRLTVVVDSPLSAEVAEELAERTGLAIDLALASSRAVRSVIREVFRNLESAASSGPPGVRIGVLELVDRAASVGAERLGISVRDEAAVGWYDRGGKVVRFGLTAGWRPAIGAILSPGPGDRVPAIGEAAWSALMTEGSASTLVDVHVIATLGGQEILLTRRPVEAAPSDHPVPEPPTDLVEELRLILSRGRLLLVVSSEPPEIAERLLPLLPDLLLPAGHRSLYLGPTGEGPGPARSLGLPLEGAGGWLHRLPELREFRFDSVGINLPAGRESKGIDGTLAPVVFVVAEAGVDAVGKGNGEGVWLLEIREPKPEDPWEWTLVAADG